MTGPGRKISSVNDPAISYGEYDYDYEYDFSDLIYSVDNRDNDDVTTLSKRVAGISTTASGGRLFDTASVNEEEEDDEEDDDFDILSYEHEQSSIDGPPMRSKAAAAAAATAATPTMTVENQPKRKSLFRNYSSLNINTTTHLRPPERNHTQRREPHGHKHVRFFCLFTDYLVVITVAFLEPTI